MNLPELKRIYKGQKSVTQGFLEINVARFARKDETFWGSFQTLWICTKAKKTVILGPPKRLVDHGWHQRRRTRRHFNDGFLQHSA